MATRLSAKRGRYVPTPRAGVEPSRHDTAFEHALNESALAEGRMMRACTEMVLESAAVLARAAAQFNDDGRGKLKVMVSRLRESVEEGRVPPIAVAIGVFMSGEEYDPAGETPEDRFLYAATCLKEAVRWWGDGEYVNARADTVRCRQSLKTITS